MPRNILVFVQIVGLTDLPAAGPSKKTAQRAPHTSSAQAETRKRKSSPLTIGVKSSEEDDDLAGIPAKK